MWCKDWNLYYEEKTSWVEKERIITIFSFSVWRFQKLSFWGSLTLYHTIPTLNALKEGGFGKHCWKVENADNIFSFSHSIFYSIKVRNHQRLICCLQMLSIWSRPKKLLFSMGLRVGTVLSQLRTFSPSFKKCRFSLQRFLSLVSFITNMEKTQILVFW